MFSSFCQRCTDTHNTYYVDIRVRRMMWKLKFHVCQTQKSSATCNVWTHNWILSLSVCHTQMSFVSFICGCSHVSNTPIRQRRRLCMLMIEISEAWNLVVHSVAGKFANSHIHHHYHSRAFVPYGVKCVNYIWAIRWSTPTFSIYIIIKCIAIKIASKNVAHTRFVITFGVGGVYAILTTCIHFQFVCARRTCKQKLWVRFCIFNDCFICGYNLKEDEPSLEKKWKTIVRIWL